MRFYFLVRVYLLFGQLFGLSLFLAPLLLSLFLVAVTLHSWDFCILFIIVHIPLSSLIKKFHIQIKIQTKQPQTQDSLEITIVVWRQKTNGTRTVRQSVQTHTQRERETEAGGKNFGCTLSLANNFHVFHVFHARLMDFPLARCISHTTRLYHLYDRLEIYRLVVRSLLQSTSGQTIV